MSVDVTQVRRGVNTRFRMKLQALLIAPEIADHTWPAMSRRVLNADVRVDTSQIRHTTNTPSRIFTHAAVMFSPISRHTAAARFLNALNAPVRIDVTQDRNVLNTVSMPSQAARTDPLIADHTVETTLRSPFQIGVRIEDTQERIALNTARMLFHAPTITPRMPSHATDVAVLTPFQMGAMAAATHDFATLNAFAIPVHMPVNPFTTPDAAPEAPLTSVSPNFDQSLTIGPASTRKMPTTRPINPTCSMPMMKSMAPLVACLMPSHALPQSPVSTPEMTLNMPVMIPTAPFTRLMTPSIAPLITGPAIAPTIPAIAPAIGATALMKSKNAGARSFVTADLISWNAGTTIPTMSRPSWDTHCPNGDFAIASNPALRRAITPSPPPARLNRSPIASPTAENTSSSADIAGNKADPTTALKFSHDATNLACLLANVSASSANFPCESADMRMINATRACAFACSNAAPLSLS